MRDAPDGELQVPDAEPRLGVFPIVRDRAEAAPLRSALPREAIQARSRRVGLGAVAHRSLATAPRSIIAANTPRAISTILSSGPYGRFTASPLRNRGRTTRARRGPRAPARRLGSRSAS